MLLEKFTGWIEELVRNDTSIREINISMSDHTCHKVNHDYEYTDIGIMPTYAREAIFQIIDLPFLDELLNHAAQKQRHWITSGGFSAYGFTYSVHGNGKTSFTVIIDPS